MPNINKAQKGLYGCSINGNEHALTLDPDNCFWAISETDSGGNHFIPSEALALYDKVRHNLDREIDDFRFSARLNSVYIDPTDRCNSNCPYCYVPAKIRKTGTQMNKDELFFVLNKIADYFSGQKNKAVIIYHASEPLLVKDIIFESIKKFSDRFHFGLQTNAVLLEQKDVEFLKTYRVGVGISLDAASASLNNRTRPAVGTERGSTTLSTGSRSAKTGGNFQSAAQAIEWFDGYEGLNVISTMTKFNLRGLPKLVEFLHRKKVPCVLLNPVRLTQKSSHSLKPDEKLMTKYFLQAVDTAIKLSEESGQRIIVANFTNIILGIIAPVARRMMCDISPCGGGRCFFTVTASGSMVPCGEFIGLKDFSGGNIFKDSIHSAMGSRAFKQIRGRFVEKVAECNSCIYRNICGAPCPAELQTLGGMYQKAVFCEFYKEIIKYAFGLIAEVQEKYCLRKDSLNQLNYQYQL